MLIYLILHCTSTKKNTSKRKHENISWWSLISVVLPFILIHCIVLCFQYIITIFYDFEKNNLNWKFQTKEQMYSTPLNTYEQGCH